MLRRNNHKALWAMTLGIAFLVILALFMVGWIFAGWLAGDVPEDLDDYL